MLLINVPSGSKTDITVNMIYFLILVFLVSTLSDSDIFIDDDWQYTSFHPTPKMSTYLFAFTVSEFTATPSSYERVKINVGAHDEFTMAIVIVILASELFLFCPPTFRKLIKS